MTLPLVGTLTVVYLLCIEILMLITNISASFTPICGIVSKWKNLTKRSLGFSVHIASGLRCLESFPSVDILKSFYDPVLVFLSLLNFSGQMFILTQM